jgi:hypothetical protein
VESLWQLSEIDIGIRKTLGFASRDRLSNQIDNDLDLVVCSSGMVEFSAVKPLRSNPRNRFRTTQRSNTSLEAWRAKRSKLVE